MLRGFGKPQWELVVMPGVDHGLFVNPGGLWQGEDAATMLASGFFDTSGAGSRNTSRSGSRGPTYDQRSAANRRGAVHN